jgi:hypothetical protein
MTYSGAVKILVAGLVGGLVILSIIHAWLFSVLMPSIPGKTWWKKGLF